MRPLEDVWADHDALRGEAVAVSQSGGVGVFDLAAEYRRWTEEQRRVNVGLVKENADLRRAIREIAGAPATMTFQGGPVDCRPVSDEYDGKLSIEFTHVNCSCFHCNMLRAAIAQRGPATYLYRRRDVFDAPVYVCAIFIG